MQILTFSFLQLFGADIYNFDFDKLSYLQKAGIIINKILAILLSAIILGTIIFKLFIHRNILVFKDKLNLYFLENKGYYRLSARFYNSTNLLLTNLNIKVIGKFTRYRQIDNAPYRINVNLREGYWVIAPINIPRTISIQLNEEDFDKENQKLLCIQGNEIKERTDEIVIIVTGEVPELGNTFTETKRYSLSKKLDLYKFTDVYVDDDTNPKYWKGWAEFDK